MMLCRRRRHRSCRRRVAIARWSCTHICLFRMENTQLVVQPSTYICPASSITLLYMYFMHTQTNSTLQMRPCVWRDRLATVSPRSSLNVKVWGLCIVHDCMCTQMCIQYTAVQCALAQWWRAYVCLWDDDNVRAMRVFTPLRCPGCVSEGARAMSITTTTDLFA